MARDLRNIAVVIVKLGRIMKRNLLRNLVCSSLILSSLLSGGSWQDGVPLNTPREGAASAAMGNYIYVLGGRTLNGVILNTVERFDINTQMWDTTIASFGAPRMNAAAIVHDGDIYLTGGSTQSSEAIKQCEIYDPVQNSWQPAQDMRKEREGHALVFFNNRIYAIGGARDQSHYVEDIEWFDDSTGQWEEAPFRMPVNSERAAFYSAVVRDTFYIFGGYYYGPISSSFYKPPLTLNWIPGPNMYTAMAYGASAQLEDSIYMIGGDTFSGITETMEVFDTRSKLISLGTPLLIPRKGTTAVTVNDTIYVIGGVTSQSSQPTTLVQKYSHIPTGIFDPGTPNLIENAQLVGYPNPFNGTINLRFQIPRNGLAKLAIFDLQGRTIKTLVNENLVEGTHEISWDGKDIQTRQVASGIYFAILRGDSFYKTFKIFYVK
jgi:N-acetylneuraminic acid mutarotase